MFYVKLNENNEPQDWPVTVAKIKHENPNVSFPANIMGVDMSSYGFIPFSYSDPDSYDAEYQEAVELTPILIDGVYVQQWEIREKYTAEEKAEKVAQVIADSENLVAQSNRELRDALLSETDWWALPDSPTMTAEQTAYRQALRDITTRANWPHLEEADWPTKP